jgi:hypothetical protein
VSDLSGELIDGRYQLISQIAQGGMIFTATVLSKRVSIAE